MISSVRAGNPSPRRNKPSRILIADERPIVRRGLKAQLEDAIETPFIQETDNGHDAFELLSGQPWSAAIVNLTIPGRGVFEILRELRSRRPKAPIPSILILSDRPEASSGARVLRAGAAGFLNIQASAAEFVAALHAVIAGRKYVPPELAADILSQYGVEGEPRHATLADREFEILCQIAAGIRLCEIGRQLCLSSKTITTYRHRILQKLRLRNNADLTIYAIQHHLLPDSLLSSLCDGLTGKPYTLQSSAPTTNSANSELTPSLM